MRDDLPRAARRGALPALAACLFAVVTAEYVIVGLLPPLSADLGVSVPTAGLLVTGHARAVTLGGLLVTALTLRAPHRATLLGLLAVFSCGNLLAALAPGFGLLLAGRVLTALTHSTCFAICVVSAAALVPAHRRGRAVAAVSAGLNLATVPGAPLGTWLGEAHGWRSTFAALAAAGAPYLDGRTRNSSTNCSPPSRARSAQASPTRPSWWAGPTSAPTWPASGCPPW